MLIPKLFPNLRNSPINKLTRSPYSFSLKTCLISTLKSAIQPSSFFGGGWNSGKVTQFKPHAEYLSSRGMITVLADYRVKTRHQSNLFDAVADAKSAIRFLRQNSKKLNIDKEKIVASGGSAGGHLAAAVASVSGLNDPKDNLKVSAKPNALVLFKPVFDNGPAGYS